MNSAADSRRVDVARDGDTFTVTFTYDKLLVEYVRAMPFARFNSDNRTWTAPVSAQAVSVLRDLDHRGLTTVHVDTLLRPGEHIPVAPAGILRATGTSRRPYAVHVAGGDDQAFAKLRAISGAAWDKKSKSLTYPPPAAAGLAKAKRAGLIDDPDHVLDSHDATVAYDCATGSFTVANNPDADAAFNAHFPAKDVVAAWASKGLDVGFLDTFSEQMYAGEMIRAGSGSEPVSDPPGLTLPLFTYQQRNAAMAAARDGFAIFDEPGLGKTMSAIAAGMWRLARGQATRVVIVCPAAVRTQWAREIARATGRDNVIVVTGSKDRRESAYAACQDEAVQWVVVHYDILARDLKQLAPVFAGAYVVADEAHRVKSPEASRTKALRKLCAPARGRLALTGTPVETNPAEWYDILSGWAVPGALGSPGEFNERYRWPNRWGGYEGARNVAELRKRSALLYARHTKKQVAAHLPPLRVQHLPLDPDAAYAAALARAHVDAAEEIRGAALARLDARPGASGGGLLRDPGEAAEVADGADMTAVALLRLLCTSPKLIHESQAPAAVALVDAGLIPDVDGPKLDHLRVVAAELKTAQEQRLASWPDGQIPEPSDVTGERMVVFTCSKRMANLTYQRLTDDGVSSVLFTGDTKSDARDAAVSAFTDPASNVQVFICTDAGAEGLNLGRCCSLLVNLDLAWTAARMSQRAQRIHRVDGTAAKYLVVNMTLTSTIEAGILRLLEERADLSDALLGEAGSRRRTTGSRSDGRNGQSVLEQVLSTYDAGKRPPVRAKKRRSMVSPAPSADDSSGGDEQLELLRGA